MRIPLRWLKRLVDVPDSPEEVSERLRRLGVPVEEVEEVGLKEDKIIISLVKEIKPHPNADRLMIAKVWDGAEERTVVTAAKNVQTGDIVPVAVEGAVLRSGLKIEPRKLRGVLSEGMFCSPEELGMDDVVWYDRREILILAREEWRNYNEWRGYVGRPLDELVPLWDHVLILESFANRPDLFSVIGVAYEAAFAFSSEVRFPELINEPEDVAQLPLKVDILNEDCRRYQARLFTAPEEIYSPLWAQQLLLFAGLRPINLVVDVTNWVLLEMGQPLHAFDYHKVPEGHIVVRLAEEGERLLALDGKEYLLSSSDLVIADETHPVALAGIIGGEETAITENSEVILLESANFSPARVRRTSMRLGLRTESSIRFEKGLPIEGVELGASRAAQLLKEWGRSKYVKKLDLGATSSGRVVVSFHVGEVKRLLGKPLSVSEVVELLTPLGFEVREADGELLEITPPPHRRDISIPADLVEEIARLKGYDYWGEELPRIVPTGYQSSWERRLESIRDLMVRYGFREVITWSLTSSQLITSWELNPEEHLRVMNPMSSEREILRAYIYPELMEVVKRNVAYGETEFALFEIGSVFSPSDDSSWPVNEYQKLAVALVYPLQDDRKIYVLREVLRGIFTPFNLKVQVRNAPAPEWAHPYAYAVITLDDEEIGFIAEVHPAKLDAMEIKGLRVAIMELSLAPLKELPEKPTTYRKLSKYQKLYRDISLILPEEVAAGEVLKIAEEVIGDLLEDVFVYDIYRGLSVPEGFVSYTFRLVIRPKDKPLSEEEISTLLKQVAELSKERLRAELRGQL